ncbi:MAG: molybdopterin molybdotransferase [Actinomycetota bacterium]|nr:molybdopterin molybdotransferase [Actinomycetota bacterium]
MLSVDDYRDGILAGIGVLAPIELPLSSAHGCVLAADVAAPWPLPSFDNSSMDGYAVRSADVALASAEAPVELTVVDDVPAGFRSTEAVTPGTAVRIMTGAPMPEGADAVLIQEDATREGEVLRVREGRDRGLNVRPAGADFVACGASGEYVAIECKQTTGRRFARSRGAPCSPRRRSSRFAPSRGSGSPFSRAYCCACFSASYFV